MKDNEKRKAYYASIVYIRHLLPRIEAIVREPDSEIRRILAEPIVQDVLHMQELIKDEGA